MVLIPNTFFYVRFSPLSIGAKNGTIVVKSPNADSYELMNKVQVLITEFQPLPVVITTPFFLK